LHGKAMANQTKNSLKGGEHLVQVLELLSTLLEQRTTSPIGLVICGGSALIALGLTPRATKDVDVVCLVEAGKLVPSTSLPSVLLEVAELAALEMGLPKDWLNSGSASLLNASLPNQGLPLGFQDRLIRQDFGPVLSIFLVGRVDQIYFKLFAAADKGGPSVHFTDLVNLLPTDDELVDAVAWARLHDPSPAFLDTVRAMLTAMERAHVVHRL
jgi:hypothetical protein